MKSAVKSVFLRRAEGPSIECVAVTVPASGVIPQFQKWGQSAPEEGQGYDKVDFTVTWEDGSEYSGRFDMYKGGVDGHGNFWASLRSRLEFYACTRRPSHFKDAHWAHHCEQMEKDGGKGQCAEILNKCATGYDCQIYGA